MDQSHRPRQRYSQPLEEARLPRPRIRVAIVGIGITKFGKASDRTLQELAFEAGREALRDANVDPKEVQFVAVGNAGGWSSETLPAVVVSEYLGLDSPGLLRVEAACASGSAAIKIAHDAVASGAADIAMALGVERMNESPTPNVVELIGRAGNYFWEFENFGLTFPGYYALYATAYMDAYGATEEDIARVAVKNHYYGSLNPKAQFQRKVTLEEVLSSR
jgi:acetyl-CoA C-acetyltransferase